MTVANAIMYTIIAFGLLFFANMKRNSLSLYNVIMFFCWVVIALSMDSYDIGNYRWGYDQELYISKEPLYDYLQFVFSKMRIPFSTFKLLYGTVVWLLLFRAMKRYTPDIALVAALFVIGPMMGFGTQLRSSMAGAIMLNALPNLLEENGKPLKYFLSIIVASMFHLMAAFYLIFLLPKCWRPKTRKLRNRMCILAVALIPITLIVFNLLFHLFEAMRATSNHAFLNMVLERLIQYFSGQMSPNMTGFLFTAGGHFGVFLLTDIMCVKMLKLRKNNEVMENGKHLLHSSYAIDYLRRLNSILILLLPCYVVSLQFDRIIGYFMPICYCLIVQGDSELTHNAKISERKMSSATATAEHRTGKTEYLLLLAYLVFCFFVNNRFSETSEFVRIVNGIGLF